MTKEEKPHRHKWQQEYAGCPNCGFGEYLSCECGEIRKIGKNGKPKKF